MNSGPSVFLTFKSERSSTFLFLPTHQPLLSYNFPLARPSRKVHPDLSAAERTTDGRRYSPGSATRRSCLAIETTRTGGSRLPFGFPSGGRTTVTDAALCWVCAGRCVRTRTVSRRSGAAVYGGRRARRRQLCTALFSLHFPPAERFVFVTQHGGEG